MGFYKKATIIYSHLRAYIFRIFVRTNLETADDQELTELDFFKKAFKWDFLDLSSPSYASMRFVLTPGTPHAIYGHRLNLVIVSIPPPSLLFSRTN